MLCLRINERTLGKEVAPLLVETPVVSTFPATSFWRS